MSLDLRQRYVKVILTEKTHTVAQWSYTLGLTSRGSNSSISGLDGTSAHEERKPDAHRNIRIQVGQSCSDTPSTNIHSIWLILSGQASDTSPAPKFVGGSEVLLFGSGMGVRQRGPKMKQICVMQ